MTIFRRRSKNTVDQAADLEAVPSASTYHRMTNFDKKNNVVVVSGEDDDDLDDTSSMDTNYSNRSYDSLTTTGLQGDDALVQAFSDFSVKLDPQNDNVLVELNVPPTYPAEDLNVQVDDGILRVSGELGSTNHQEQATDGEGTAQQVEQAFQLDEQSLDVHNLTANLSSSGQLTITAPKKKEEESTLSEYLSIRSERPPIDPFAFRVILNVPGVYKEDLHVSYANGKLRVSGNRHFGRVRSFKRTIPVDTQHYNVDMIRPYLHRGQLTILVPVKKAAPVSRTIEIQQEEVNDEDASSVPNGANRKRLDTVSEAEMEEIKEALES